MRSNKLTGNKSNKKYIYTEADLGEGLLDAGVSYPYTNEAPPAEIQMGATSNYEIAAKANGFYATIVPTVQNDLSYSYYL